MPDVIDIYFIGDHSFTINEDLTTKFAGPIFEAYQKRYGIDMRDKIKFHDYKTKTQYDIFLKKAREGEINGLVFFYDELFSYEYIDHLIKRSTPRKCIPDADVRRTWEEFSTKYFAEFYEVLASLVGNKQIFLTFYSDCNPEFSSSLQEGFIDVLKENGYPSDNLRECGIVLHGTEEKFFTTYEVPPIIKGINSGEITINKGAHFVKKLKTPYEVCLYYYDSI